MQIQNKLFFDFLRGQKPNHGGKNAGIQAIDEPRDQDGWQRELRRPFFEQFVSVGRHRTLRCRRQGGPPDGGWQAPSYFIVAGQQFSVVDHHIDRRIDRAAVPFLI